jgi:hypothetical protein
MHAGNNEHKDMCVPTTFLATTAFLKNSINKVVDFTIETIAHMHETMYSDMLVPTMAFLKA